MGIKYKKRAKGGYYAFVTPENSSSEKCVVVERVEHHTPNRSYFLYWAAKLHGNTYLGDTRKEAIESAMQH